MPSETLPTTLTELLERAANFPATGLRLLDRHEQPDDFSWTAVRAAAIDVAAALQASWVVPGDRIALIYPTGREFFAAFFGILLAGAVPVPLYPPVRFGRLEEYHQRTAVMLQAVDARMVLTEKRLQRFLGPTIRTAQPLLGCSNLSALPTGTWQPVEIPPEAWGLIQFSSGTTVDPKAVALSHRAILAQVRLLNNCWPPGSGPQSVGVEDSGVSWLPLYHDMGLIGCVFAALERPGTLTLFGPELFVARPALWLRAISHYRATISVAPNFAFGLATSKIRDEELVGVDLSTWRIALNGAEPVAPGVLRAFQARFARWGFRPEAMTPVYGLSEATLAVTFSSVDQLFKTTHFDRDRLALGEAEASGSSGLELVSLGIPLPGFKLKIAHRTGRPLPAGKVGIVQVRGPSLMDGYLGRPDATAQVLRDGWLDTGDLGFLYQGELYLTGRAKDILILRGRNYSPMDLEQAADPVPGVRKGCVVAVSYLPAGGSGEELLVFAEHAQAVRPSAPADLERAVSEAILVQTGLKVDRVLILEPGSLPRTSSGKLRRQEALRRFLAGELTPPARVTPWLLAKAWARSALAYARLDHEGRGPGSEDE